MAIAVKCECGRLFRARDEYAGRRATCPGCDRPILIEGERTPDHDVFISYSSQDRLIADAVCSTLEANKIRCWMAPRDIRPGMDWGSAIIDAIGDSAVMVLLYTTHSNVSPQVLREVERAVSKGVAVVPVRLEEVPPSKSMEYFISASHWLDAMTRPLERHLTTLADTIKALLRDRERGGNRPAAAAPREAIAPTAPAPTTTALPEAGAAAVTDPPPRPAEVPRHRRRWTAVAAFTSFFGAAALAAVIVPKFLNRPSVAIDPATRPADPVGDAETSAQPTTTAALTTTQPTTSPATREVDLLALIDPARDAVAGRWTTAGGALVSDGYRFARIRIPYRPPLEYDFRIEFERVEGENDVTQIMPVGNQAVAWQMSGMDGRGWGFTEVQGVNGAVRFPPKIENGKRHVAEVRVRRDSVSAYFDGRLYRQIATGPSRFSVPERWAIGPPILGLGTCVSPTVFHKVQLVEVTGQGWPRARGGIDGPPRRRGGPGERRRP